MLMDEQYSQECFCSNAIGTSGKLSAATDCNMACGGDATEACGGPNRLNVFHNDAATTPVAATGPSTNAGPGNWGFIGCYTDSAAGRTLPYAAAIEGGPAKMSVARCTAACETAGYNISGVEYSAECFCGNAFMNGGAPAPDGLDGCSMPCNGNSSEFCGGPNRLDVYGRGQKSAIAPKWGSLGCYTDTVVGRTLAFGMAVPGGQANMTQENCQDACHAAKYNLAGVEYSQECYCDNAFKNGGGPAPDGDAQCNMACNGNSGEKCGGPNRLNVFSYAGGPTSSVASTTATPTVTATPGPSTTAPGSAQGLPVGWSYRGCYVDGKYGRILYQQPDDPQLTVEKCVQTCKGLGKHIAGMEYTAQCFCADSIINGGALASSDNQCAMPCGGNSSEICGGPDRMSIYASGNFSTYDAPKAQTTNLPGKWKYQGCLTDTPQPRVLPYQIDMETNLTISNCLSLCSLYGYSAGSVEYGQQCFCGDDTDRVNAGVQYRPEGDCNTACIGDPTAMCGGANAMNYYTWEGLNTWHQGAGNAAGQYKFLIGGPVIPLITTASRNGKVSFVEKHGTGPGNSTGAFELDLSAIDNYSQAWRELQGLKTDVFCSAGLTLPDKSARQINIGGWSADSLYGIRFFTPDGAPGVQSYNGWEENVNEVKLQIGRWYPTAMQLVNGSILVVGGEDGSNGAPVPNLEVIPKPAGGNLLFCDWLQRTDPNNLYPFLAVLPTGNIFVAYYNEARILDEKTFQTIRTLPNIPGAVNNFLGGRTYPLEGSFMIMPQKAPYTDPLEVLICGGSTPYQGFALDNCVSIHPEVPGANWTIHRMPSRRVIPTMTALPDGTYIIMNGAHQGVAGFGLANDPNHNALMYDPTAPLTTRFTRLANTTIDRLYHNEALLLEDGRVLVSGSDPENLDGKYPQEYRVEVFIPPYLMALNEPLAINTNLASSTITNGTVSNGAAVCGARPQFTLNNQTDWNYGGSYKITMTCGSAAKISLMGAVSTTHGHSMGQRTIFPAFSCSGSSCTITAPPNGHVTGGPGWFMVFVLNSAGVPSYAKWVRIGGDPAGLGNWPAYPDFTRPGV